MAPTPRQTQMSKAKALSTGKQPKARVVRYLKRQDSQVQEGARNVLLLKGIRCSDQMSTVLKDLVSLVSVGVLECSLQKFYLGYDQHHVSNFESSNLVHSTYCFITETINKITSEQ